MMFRTLEDEYDDDVNDVQALRMKIIMIMMITMIMIMVMMFRCLVG